MSFYPLVDDTTLLKELDGWLFHTIFTSLKVRRTLLASAGYETIVPPHKVAKHDLPKFFGTSSDGTVLDLRLPSFVRMGKLPRRAAQTHGPNAIGHPRSNQYYLGA